MRTAIELFDTILSALAALAIVAGVLCLAIAFGA